MKQNERKLPKWARAPKKQLAERYDVCTRNQRLRDRTLQPAFFFFSEDKPG